MYEYIIFIYTYIYTCIGHFPYEALKGGDVMDTLTSLLEQSSPIAGTIIYI
jgi:hypothetical protein